MRKIVLAAAFLGVLILSVWAGLWLASGEAASPALQMKPGKWEITRQVATAGSQQHVSEKCLSAQEAAQYMTVDAEKLLPGSKAEAIPTDGKDSAWRVTFPGGSYTTIASADGEIFTRVMHAEKQTGIDAGDADIIYTGRWLGDCVK